MRATPSFGIGRRFESSRLRLLWLGCGSAAPLKIPLQDDAAHLIAAVGVIDDRCASVSRHSAGASATAQLCQERTPVALMQLEPVRVEQRVHVEEIDNGDQQRQDQQHGIV